MEIVLEWVAQFVKERNKKVRYCLLRKDSISAATPNGREERLCTEVFFCNRDGYVRSSCFGHRMCFGPSWGRKDPCWQSEERSRKEGKLATEQVRSHSKSWSRSSRPHPEKAYRIEQSVKLGAGSSVDTAGSKSTGDGQKGHEHSNNLHHLDIGIGLVLISAAARKTKCEAMAVEKEDKLCWRTNETDSRILTHNTSPPIRSSYFDVPFSACTSVERKALA